ncbi:hypothetical protein OPT61_g8713 [Boeremia exigua]|uniref:Uncharacterized protein n=1 Tax=Boeremia exigua TaxID=749465 RepID=A0ACC2HX48_9PLEO|nr:hypothetical protein OPT61_g8713 [Boeremia exigua]
MNQHYQTFDKRWFTVTVTVRARLAPSKFYKQTRRTSPPYLTSPQHQSDTATHRQLSSSTPSRQGTRSHGQKAWDCSSAHLWALHGILFKQEGASQAFARPQGQSLSLSVTGATKLLIPNETTIATESTVNPAATHVTQKIGRKALTQVHELEYGDNSASTPSNMGNDWDHCHYCKKAFASQFAYDCHLLGCTALHMKVAPDSSPETTRTPDRVENFAPNLNLHTVTVETPAVHRLTATSLASNSQHASLQTMTLRTKAPVPRHPLHTSIAPADMSSAQGPSLLAPVKALATLQAPSVQPPGTGTFVCNINGCQRSYNSEPGLKMHQTDAHGVGGKGLDLHGRDAWMLGQRERERLKSEGLLRIPMEASRGGSSNRGGNRGGRNAPVSAVNHALPRAAPAQGALATPNRQSHQQASINTALPPFPLPTNQNAVGAFEMEQAKSVCGKTLRLLLQTDMFIHHDGKMSVSGIEWTRIGVERQSAAVELFDEMCHLPRNLQRVEYVPAPKTFMAEYTAQYPVAEFESAAARDPKRPGMGVIAMACSKIFLSNGRCEIVKIAAIDVLTGRVLMSHLVCTDPNTQVANWNRSVTGLSSFKDLEEARQAGYKVLKGWSAARSALFRFIDKDTIVVGHNLRSELDALRIIHGRAVDISKVVEKAAQGPLSKAQVSLDSWCRDVANVARLQTDPVFGRDCIMNAFAAREIGLWAIKNREKLETVAKQKSKEYQLVMKA